MARRLYGLGVSAGEAAGPVARLAGAPTLPEEQRLVEDVDDEVRRGADALKATCKRFVPVFRRTWSFQRDIHNINRANDAGAEPTRANQSDFHMA